MDSYVVDSGGVFKITCEERVKCAETPAAVPRIDIIEWIGLFQARWRWKILGCFLYNKRGDGSE